MHPVRLVQKWFERNIAFMHCTRAAALVSAVAGLLRGGTVTLTHLGRALGGAGHTKHKIKRVDRPLGNRRLHGEQRLVYAAFAAWLLNGIERPAIVVDWSDCEPGHEWLMLTAAPAVGGRTLVVY